MINAVGNHFREKPCGDSATFILYRYLFFKAHGKKSSDPPYKYLGENFNETDPQISVDLKSEIFWYYVKSSVHMNRYLTGTIR